MKNKWLIILAVFLVGAGFLFYYINTTLPKKIKELVNQHAQEVLHRQVTFQDIKYNFPKGVRITGLTVYRKDQPDAPFIYIPEIQFNILLPAIIKDKRIIIPAVEVSEPFVHIIRETQSVWNFSDLLQNPSSSGGSPKVFVGSVTLKNGRIKFTDNAGSEPSVKNIENIQLSASLSIKKGIKYDLSLKIPEEGSSLHSRGEFLLPNKSLKARLEISNAAVENYMTYFPPPEGLTVRQGLLHSLTADVEGGLHDWSARLSFQSDANIDWKTTRLKGQYQSNGILLTHQNGATTITGAAQSKKTFLNAGDVSIDGGVTLENITAMAKRDTFKLDTKIEASGSAIRFPGGYVRGDISTENVSLLKTGTDVDITAKGLTIPHVDGKFNDRSLSGDIRLSGASFARSGKSIEISAAGTLEGIEFKSPGVTASGTLNIGSLNLSRPDKDISIQSSFKTTGLKIVKDKLVLRGEPEGQISLLYSPENKEFNLQDGYIDLKSASISGLPQTGPITGIQSRVRFQENTIYTSQLNATVADMPVKLNGTLEDPFGKRIADIQVQTSSVSLGKITPFFKRYLDRLRIQPEGSLTPLTIGYSGGLDNIDPAGLEAAAGLKDAAIKGDGIPSPVSALNGDIRWKDQTFSWKNLSGVFAKKSFRTSGTLTDLQSPRGSVQLDYPPFRISVSGGKLSDTVDIEELNVTFGQSNLSASGNVALQNLSNPDVSLKASGKIRFADLKLITPLKEKLSGLPIETTADVNLFFRGNPKAWEEGRVNLQAVSPLVRAGGYKAENARLNFLQDPQQTDTFSFTSDVYGGNLTIDGTLETTQKGIPFRGRSQLINLNLADLRTDTKLKDKNIAGALSINTTMSGNLTLPESYTGRGALSVRNGYLWKFDLLKGIGGILLIPEFENFVFTEAAADFTISNKKIQTNDLVLTGNKADLLGTGWIGFDKSLQLEISPKFKEIEILKSSSMKKDLTAFLTQTHSYITINVTGTLDKPKYAIEKSPAKVLKKTTGTIIKGVQDIFEGMINQ